MYNVVWGEGLMHFQRLDLEGPLCSAANIGRGLKEKTNGPHTFKYSIYRQDYIGNLWNWGLVSEFNFSYRWKVLWPAV